MPTSPTEIVHLAFTHHRIGIHDRPAATGAPAAHGPGVLRPFGDLSRLGETDRSRSLGLAYLEVANREKDGARGAKYREEALGLLSAVRAAGLRDPALEAGLARLRFDLGLGGVVGHAESALAQPGLEGQDRCNCLFLLADGYDQEGRHREAVAALRELARLRRHPVDWLLLARCEGALGDEAAAAEALATAARINPRLWKVQRHLAERYRRRGDQERADWHQRRAVP
jgi:tetratricopeptide (TPR) repeat protein